MDSVFGILAIVILGIAVPATRIYLVLKAASYFKRTFVVSLWPGVIAMFSMLHPFTASAYFCPHRASAVEQRRPALRPCRSYHRKSAGSNFWQPSFFHCPSEAG